MLQLHIAEFRLRRVFARYKTVLYLTKTFTVEKSYAAVICYMKAHQRNSDECNILKVQGAYVALPLKLHICGETGGISKFHCQIKGKNEFFVVESSQSIHSVTNNRVQLAM